MTTRIRIEPVHRHVPGYPRLIEVDDWRSLLEPTSRRAFRPSTLILAGLLGSSLFLSLPSSAGELTGQNAKAVAIAEAELAKAPPGTWSERAVYMKKALFEGNPELTVPQVRISFGNSYSGVLDEGRMATVTRELFAAYGVVLQPNYPVKRKGLEFTADGWDPQRNLGFEILQRGDVEPTDIDARELEVARAELAENELTLLLLERGAIMDGDTHVPTRAYLQSVLDYLDWLKAQGRI